MIYIALEENNILIRNMMRAFNYAFNIVHKVCNKILCRRSKRYPLSLFYSIVQQLYFIISSFCNITNCY